MTVCDGWFKFKLNLTNEIAITDFRHFVRIRNTLLSWQISYDTSLLYDMRRRSITALLLLTFKRWVAYFLICCVYIQTIRVNRTESGISSHKYVKYFPIKTCHVDDDSEHQNTRKKFNKMKPSTALLHSIDFDMEIESGVVYIAHQFMFCCVPWMQTIYRSNHFN